MSNIYFACTQIKTCGNNGVLVPDKDGYYQQVVGALNIDNTSDHRYTAEKEVQDLFERSGALNRRATSGKLRGEVEHPDWPTGMSEDDYAARMLTIDARNACVHWDSFWVDLSQNNRNTEGGQVYDIHARFKPSGVHAKMLEDQLKNGKENVCFSLRAFTIDRYQGSKRMRKIVEVVTFDYVNDPGIPVANKFGSAQKVVAREAHNPAPLSELGLRRALAKPSNGRALESSQINADSFFKALGWEKPTDLGFTKWGRGK